MTTLTDIDNFYQARFNLMEDLDNLGFRIHCQFDRSFSRNLPGFDGISERMKETARW